MQQVAIVTDSSSCIAGHLAKAYGIEIVPYDLAFDDLVYRDGVDPVGAFYDLLRAAKRPPTTSAPSPGLYLEAFRAASTRASSVLCITLPSNLSSSHNASQQAVIMAEERLPGVQFRSVTAPAVAAGQGLISLEAAELAAQGASLNEVAARVAALAPGVFFYAVLDSLEYLAKGGHVPAVAAWLGDRVGFKPVLTARHGKVERLTQVRSKTRAIERMLLMMEDANPERAPIRAILMHADAPGEATRFSEKIRERFDCREVLITEFTPVMGAHSGPGVVGIAYRVLDMDEFSESEQVDASRK